MFGKSCCQRLGLRTGRDMRRAEDEVGRFLRGARRDEDEALGEIDDREFLVRLLPEAWGGAGVGYMHLPQFDERYLSYLRNVEGARLLRHRAHRGHRQVRGEPRHPQPGEGTQPQGGRVMSAVLKLVQGTPEWHAHRQGMRNASETPAVLGLSPWLTPYGLWLIKTGRHSQPVTPPMAHGTQLEPQARAAYEAQTGEIMNPLVMQDGPYSASLDGINLAGSLIVEIKCPFRGRQSSLWREAVSGNVPCHYAAQVQHQLMVSGAVAAHLWVYAEGEGLLLTLQRDEALMGAIHEAWEAFQPYLDQDTPPPLTDADAEQRDDAAWSQAAQDYLAAKRQADTADEALEAARKALVALSHHPRETGAGVSVVRLWKPGNVDYKRVPELKGVELDRYRGEGRQEVRVTVVK